MLNRPLLGWTLFLVAVSASATSRANDFKVPGDANTLQGAIDLAEATTGTDDTITVVASNTYEGTLNIKESIRIQAEDGAKVILVGRGDEPLIQINGQGSSTTVTLQRLILTTTGSAIVVTNGGVINLRNLVITEASKAIDCQNTTGEIVQVTFYNLGAGIVCTGSTMTIRNNIFAILSGTPISLLVPPVGTPAPITFNLFFQVSAPTPGEQRGSPTIDDADPAFVDPANLDFHLTSDSEAIGKGDPDGTDLGAYGGPSPAQSKPFQTQGVSVVCDPPTGTSCRVSWTANADYLVSGYRVSFSAPLAPVGSAYDGQAAGGVVSPVSYQKGDVDVCPPSATTCAVTFTGLTDSVTAPDQPTGLTAGIGDGKVLLSWNPVASATSYDVYSGTTSGGGVRVASDIKWDTANPTVDYTLPDLTNGTTYYVSVGAVSRPTLFAIVNTLYGADVTATTQLSAPSDQKTGEYGTAQFSAISSEVGATPQLVVGFPPLQDTGGCFIATAAYGSALAPQVEVLRTWRDRYLSTNAPGRAFVAAYRAFSPPVADRLRRSEGLRSLVRILLLPVVGFAWLWIAWPWAAGVCALTGIAVVSGWCWKRRDPPRA